MSPSLAPHPIAKTAVGSNVEVIEPPEIVPPVHANRSSVRVRRPPARYNDFNRHDT